MTASPAMISARITTTRSFPWLEISLTTCPASSGVATAMTAENTVTVRNRISSFRYGRANVRIRLAMPGWSL